jgi:peptide/nickel transport system substrate-binding protein
MNPNSSAPRRRSGRRTAALVVGALVLSAAACGDDDDNDDVGSGATSGGSTAPASTSGGTDTTSAGDTTTAPDGTGDAGGDAAMTVTLQLDPDAVWEDGSPITVDDFVCTRDAQVNTPGSLTTVGYDKVSSIETGASDSEIVIGYSEPFAAYKTLFNPLLRAARHEDCNDVSLDFEDTPPDSARQYRVESWSPSQAILVANENYYGDDPATTERVVMVPLADSDTEIAAIKAGEVDFVYPQFFAGIQDALADPNIQVEVRFGGDFEALYFQQLDGPFADPVFREAFSKSVDREALFQQIYVPIEPTAEMLNCGPIVPGAYCDNADAPFADTYDPEGAAALLEDNGWTQGSDGFWQSPEGEVPEIRWLVNTGNTRRESMQAYLIPVMQEAGFNVVADNCDAACMFQQRVPALDYDLSVYISTVAPDPTYLTSSWACDLIPTEENNFLGQNQSGWCNEEATEMLHEADRTIDEAARTELIKSVLQLMADDHALLPLFQFPKSGAFRTDRVGPPETVAADLNNFRAFDNFAEWEDVDGDGTIVIGAEQWPECLNPVTECANSSWYVWTLSFVLQPGVWDTTDDQQFVITELVTEEPVVTVM